MGMKLQEAALITVTTVITITHVSLSCGNYRK